MKDTIKLISKYDWTLVEVIQWLDRNGHSDEEIRNKVDKMLNFKQDLKEQSKQEIKQAREVLERYEY